MSQQVAKQELLQQVLCHNEFPELVEHGDVEVASLWF
jgi:hypothetical protein